MDLHLTLVLIADTLAIIMSLIAIYKSNETIDSGMDSIEKIMKHIEIKLETLPKGSVEIINQPFSNKIIIEIQKNVFREE